MMFQTRFRGVSAFLWDVDGTIVDSREFAFDVYNDVLRQLGKRTFTSKEFRELFSSDYRVHLKRVGINSANEVDFLVNAWNARLATDRHRFKLYNGILNVLTYLHKWKCIVTFFKIRLNLRYIFVINNYRDY